MGSTTEVRINLAALKRQDPYIGNITDTSTHVAVYSFSPQSNEWEKTDVEGTLFVYRRVAPPYWGFTILNRLSMENLTEPLTSELEFQTQNAFLLYRNAKLLIYGIWFYDQEDCKRIGELLEKLCRESPQIVPNDTNVQRINIFGGCDNNIIQTKDAARKFSSPTSNSANSVSPGSSVGGGRRPPSNEEADSESDDKEVAQSNKASINILDLLSKAQDKYDKEKRNTPDPAIENLKNGTILSPADTDLPLVKPVPVKPAHPQKLDVATLFKQQQPKPPEVNQSVISNGQANTVPLVPTPTMNTPYAGMMSHPASNLPPPTAAVTIPQQQQTRRAPRSIGRSLSMTEMAMRQHLDAYMNGNVMSVEEVEAGMNKMSSVSNRQQQVNSTLDRMIDRINAGAAIPAAVVSKSTPLPGIQEAGKNFTTSAGNSGSIVVNGNHALHSENEVFNTETTTPYAGTSVRPPTQTFVIPFTGVRQRSMSSSGIHQANHHAATSSIVPIPTNAQFTPNFPLVPNLPNHATPKHTIVTSAVFPPMPRNAEPQLLLHGNAIINDQPLFTLANPNPLVSSIATAVSSTNITQKTDKVTLNATVMPHASKSSPALATTLISPEDFERSATTPQKKLELKQRLLQEVQQPQQKLPTPQTPLTKDQLQQTLVSLLQKDGPFLATIHDAYLTSFKQT